MICKWPAAEVRIVLHGMSGHVSPIPTMQPTYEGAARRLARVLELSSQATQEMTALPRGKRARQDDARRIAAELSKALVVPRPPDENAPS